MKSKMPFKCPCKSPDYVYVVNNEEHLEWLMALYPLCGHDHRILRLWCLESDLSVETGR